MTAPAVHLVGTDPRDGCTACGSPATVTLSAFDGRRCSDHATLPPGGFRRDLADDMVAVGRADAAFAYLGAWLAAEADRRFAAARGWVR